MNCLLDVLVDDEAHRLVGLLDGVGQLVEDFEPTYNVMREAALGEALRFF